MRISHYFLVFRFKCGWLFRSHGIGYSTVKHLARKGAKVYLGARNEEKGKAAIARLDEEGIAPGNAIYFPCDISTPLQAKQAAEDFMSREDRLDVLGMLHNIWHSTGESNRSSSKQCSFVNSIPPSSPISILIHKNRIQTRNSRYICRPWVATDLRSFTPWWHICRDYDGQVSQNKPTIRAYFESRPNSHFSTFQLTLSLLPLLKKTAEELDPDVRIVTVRLSVWHLPVNSFGGLRWQVNSTGHRLSRGTDSNIQLKTFEDFNKDFSKDNFPYFSQYCKFILPNIGRRCWT